MHKIYHLDEMEEFFGSDEWKLQIDITDIWNKYQNKEILTESFNQEYAKRLNSYKPQISDLGNDVWNDIVDDINKIHNCKDQEESISLYESVYDWADKNDVLIKIK